MWRILFFFCFGLYCNHLLSQELVVPINSTARLEANETLEWNRYVSGNFTILSVDDTQGRWLSNNIQQIKRWCVNRWGFPDFNLNRECRIFCVPNKTLMKKLFGIDAPHFEERENILALWLILDNEPAKVIPQYLTPLLYYEFQKEYKTRLSLWFVLAASELNTTPKEVRAKLSSSIKLTENNYMPFGEFFNLTKEQFKSLDVDKQKLYLLQSIYLNLLLRKEFGEAKLQGFLNSCVVNDAEKSLQMVYGYKNYQEFESKYWEYFNDLNRDLSSGKTPDSYLNIQPVLYK